MMGSMDKQSREVVKAELDTMMEVVNHDCHRKWEAVAEVKARWQEAKREAKYAKTNYMDEIIKWGEEEFEGPRAMQKS